MLLCVVCVIYDIVVIVTISLCVCVFVCVDNVYSTAVV